MRSGRADERSDIAWDGEGSRFAEGQALVRRWSRIGGDGVAGWAACSSRLLETQPAEGALESGVADDRDRLLLEHLPTVRYIARRIHERLPQHVELDDLISAGVVGLIDAFSKFDHDEEGAVQELCAVPDSRGDSGFVAHAGLESAGAAAQGTRGGGGDPVGDAAAGTGAVEQEIAGEMELSLEEYQQLLGDLKGLEIGSLHMERSEDSGDEELSYIPGSPDEDPLFRCLKGEMKQRLMDAIEELPEKERMVLTLYYYEELTMKEIGLTLGVVESRVSKELTVCWSFCSLRRGAML